MPLDWPGVASLVDPTRRAVYGYVRTAHRPVTREETAAALDISRNLATFHLDKLVQAGLLEVDDTSPEGRRAARGRTPKVYRPSGVQLALTVPERRYELIGHILADAIAADPSDARDRALRLARERGIQVAHRATNGGAGAAAGADAAVTDPVELLDELGFEPQPGADQTVLHNCPFHELAQRQPDLVCRINHAFVAGLLDGLGATDTEAVLAPRPDACCVALRPSGAGSSG